MNKHAPIFKNTQLDPNADYLSEDGAYKLAARIRAFWNARCLAPKVWVAKITGAGPEREIFVVKSDMVGGRPR